MIKRIRLLINGLIQGYGMPTLHKCPKCNSRLYREIYIDEYPFVCLNCEENFYSIEVKN